MPEVSLEEAAKLLNKSERTLRDYIKRKKLRATKVGGKWFVDVESTRKLVGSLPEEAAKTSDLPSGLPSGSSGSSDLGVEHLACFRLAREVFAAPMWLDEKSPFWIDLNHVKGVFFRSLGAGYYSYGANKVRHYSEARAALGGAIALVCGCADEVDGKADLWLVEQKLIPAVTSLIRKMEKKENR
jgi:excisionase family DNA binding protein